MEATTEALDQHLARGLLRSAVMWLELEAESGRRHAWRAREIGAIAILGGFGGLAARAERMLAEADHIHAGDDDHSAHDPVLPHGPELSSMFPPYSAVSVLNHARQSAPPHLSLAFDRHFDAAWELCRDDISREEVAAVRALLGDFEGTLSLLGQADYPHDRLIGPMMVVAIEAQRLGNPSLTRKLVLGELGGQNGLDWWVPVAAGLLGRMPWQGYPLPES